MIDAKSFKEFLGAFGWFLNLGKSDTEHIKNEVNELLVHSSQSLQSLLELTDALPEIPLAHFDAQTYWPVANNCFYLFTSPEAAQQARTHCTDIERDIRRITFRMSNVLRAENLNWKGVSDAFQKLANADAAFLDQYAVELQRIGTELNDIGTLLTASDIGAAHRRYEALRTSLWTSRSGLSSEIARMQAAQTHIHQLLA